MRSLRATDPRYWIWQFLLVLASGFALGDELNICECNLENLGANCAASISKDGGLILVESSDDNCSRVEWYSDSKLNVSIVNGNMKAIEWLEDIADPKLSVLACRSCGDALKELQRGFSFDADAREEPALQAADGTWHCTGKLFIRKGEWLLSDYSLNLSQAEMAYSMAGQVTSVVGEQTVSSPIEVNGTFTNTSSEIELENPSPSEPWWASYRPTNEDLVGVMRVEVKGVGVSWGQTCQR